MKSDHSRLAEFMEHLSELVRRILTALAVFFIFFFLFFAFKPVWVDIGLIRLLYPYPSLFDSFAVQFFNLIKRSLLPPEMILINVNSFDTLVAVIYVAMSFALIFSLPVWIYELAVFVAPALYQNEKRILRLLLIPSTLLFVAGAMFAYYVVLPILFRFLYYLTIYTGVEPTISVRTFVSVVISYTIALGLSFELPMVMLGLTYIGVVGYKAWIKNWRYAVVVAFFIALLISPGATGGLMETTIGLTLSALYFVGALLSRHFTGRQKI
ncbi:MAG: twin-arginine translocase subunit TatC [Conexivisphaerales archaeon]